MEVSKPVGYVSVIVIALIAIGIAFTFTNIKVTQMRNERTIEYVRTHDSGKVKVTDGTFNKPSKKVIAEIEAKHRHVTRKFVWPIKGGRYRVTITYE